MSLKWHFKYQEKCTNCHKFQAINVRSLVFLVFRFLGYINRVNYKGMLTCSRVLKIAFWKKSWDLDFFDCFCAFFVARNPAKRVRGCTFNKYANVDHASCILTASAWHKIVLAHFWMHHHIKTCRTHMGIMEIGLVSETGFFGTFWCPQQKPRREIKKSCPTYVDNCIHQGVLARCLGKEDAKFQWVWSDWYSKQVDMMTITCYNFCQIHLFRSNKQCSEQCQLAKAFIEHKANFQCQS